MSPLEQRVRANCCPFHGLTAAAFDKHVAGIVRMIEKARAVPDYPQRFPQ